MIWIVGGAMERMKYQTLYYNYWYAAAVQIFQQGAINQIFLRKSEISRDSEFITTI